MPDSTRLSMLSKRGLLFAGTFLVVLGLVGLIIGLMLIDSLTSDFRASLEVSESAVHAIGDTVEMIGEVNKGADSTLRSASAAASSAAGATRRAATGLQELAVFLDEELPRDIEAISSALPGAIDAADAIDATLSALSLIGVDYAPEEPFGDSLRRVEGALEELPEEIRNQSSSLSLIVPSAETMAEDVETLAGDLDELNRELGDLDELANSYALTVIEAEAAIENAGSSLDRTVLSLHIALILAALAASVVGLALINVDRRLSVLSSTQPTGDEVVLIDGR